MVKGKAFIVNKREKVSRGIWKSVEQERKRSRLDMARTVYKRREASKSGDRERGWQEREQ